eukprot:scaffold238779_cov60-Attheya_sp.AAC.1
MVDCQRKAFIIIGSIVALIVLRMPDLVNFNRSWVGRDEASLTSMNLSWDRVHPRISIQCNSSGSVPECIDAVGVVGHWEYTLNRKPLVSPECCDVDPTARRYNISSTESIPCAPSIWSSFQGQTNTYQENGGYECVCPGYVDRYTWRSPDIPEKFDAKKTCKLLGQKRVLFIGDSTVRQVASTLINVLFPAACQTQISYTECDTLIHETFHKLNRGKYWTKAVLDLKPDIVIIGVGPHIDSFRNYKRVVDTVVTDMVHLRNSSKTKHITFVWKTQHPHGCTHDILMPDNPAQAAREAVGGTRKYSLKNDWDLYLLSHLQEMDLPYLDMRMLYSRSDAHSSSRVNSSIWENDGADCLHLCTPGPLDIIAPLFQKLVTSINKNQ